MHSAEDHKHCKDCDTHKSPKEFYVDRSRADGRQVYCKVCQTKRMRRPKTHQATKSEESDSTEGSEEAGEEAERGNKPKCFVVGHMWFSSYDFVAFLI